MSRCRVFIAFVLGTAVAVCVGAAQETKKEKQKAATPATKQKAAEPAAADRKGDEAAIRANVNAFARAYNAHDAKAIAALFTPEAQVVDDEGNTIEGRKEIEQVFAGIFEGDPKTQIEVSVTSIRFVGSDLAIEVGATKTTPAPNEVPEYGRYTVLHVKRDGKWLMAAARDTEGEPPTNHERLLPIAWLIGDWIDEGKESVVLTSCRWSEDKNFILQDAKVRIEGMTAMNVTMRIGWDPLTKQIKSWVFDSEGGYGEGLWARDGDQWIVKATGVRRDGSTASATNIYAPRGKDSYRWQSTDRVVGGELMPPVGVTVVRKPPQPKTAEASTKPE